MLRRGSKMGEVPRRRKKSFKKKPHLIKTASKVSKQAATYNKQLSKCMSKLDRNKYILF